MSAKQTMQIIIPMSGFGERFRRAGYKVPKPLIEVSGKPVIGHIIDMFKNDNSKQEFIFICNNDHLQNPGYRMEETIKSYCPTARIIGIPPHKLGPVHTVLSVKDHINPTIPTVVNYCDFTCYWNWADFRNFVETTKCAGAIPAYKGFHPHSLGTTNYAYMKQENLWVSDIQEKQPYTDNRMEEYASSGTYYFASGQTMLDAFAETIRQNLNINGEFYISLAYKPLLAQNAPVAVYPLQHFMQWGTPEDLHEYNEWAEIFDKLLQPKQPQAAYGALVMPMAGLGKRFTEQGYTKTKPLIEVSGKPMVIQAADSFPPAASHSFVLRSDMPGYEEISTTLKQNFPGAVIETVSHVTEGQAISALIGLDALEQKQGRQSQPITFTACDSAMLYDTEKFRNLALSPDVDVIVWAVRGHANAIRKPQMFGWVDADENGLIKNVSVKTPLSSPSTDPIVTGSFTFKKADDYRRTVESLISRNGRVNGEFYIDSCINDAISLGLKCYIFEVDNFISWGTPDDLKTFEYWQSCFHKWQGHNYQLQNDPHIPAGKVQELEEKYQAWLPPLPGKRQ